MGLVAEYDGKAWLFTLGAADEAPKAGEQIVKIGPLPPITATDYLLRVNSGGRSGRQRHLYVTRIPGRSRSTSSPVS